MHESRKTTLLNLLIAHPDHHPVISKSLKEMVERRIAEYAEQAFLSSPIPELLEMIAYVESNPTKPYTPPTPTILPAIKEEIHGLESGIKSVDNNNVQKSDRTPKSFGGAKGKKRTHNLLD